MNMDFAEAAKAVTIFKDIIMAGAAIVTATVACITASVAVHGITKWRQEMQGKADFDVARAVAKATYKARDALFRSRSPMIWSWEYPEGYDPDSSTSMQKAEAQAHVYNNRFKPVEEAFLELHAQLLEAEALWGGHVREKGEVLVDCFNDLKVAAQAIIDDAAAGGGHYLSNRQQGVMDRATVHGHSHNRKNPLTARTYHAVSEIESVLVKHLPRARTGDRQNP